MDRDFKNLLEDTVLLVNSLDMLTPLHCSGISCADMGRPVRRTICCVLQCDHYAIFLAFLEPCTAKGKGLL